MKLTLFLVLVLSLLVSAMVSAVNSEPGLEMMEVEGDSNKDAVGRKGNRGERGSKRLRNRGEDGGEDRRAGKGKRQGKGKRKGRESPERSAVRAWADQLSENDYSEESWKSIFHSHSASDFFNAYAKKISNLFKEYSAKVNFALIGKIARFLNELSTISIFFSSNMTF